MYNLFEYIDKEKLNKVLFKFNLKENELDIIKDIISMEWNFFDKVKGINGRAICQDSPLEFILNRLAQYLVYSNVICLHIQSDYKKCLDINFNPVFGKYARMVQSTDPNIYKEIKDNLPQISPVKQYALKEIGEIFYEALKKVEKNLPETSKNARPKNSVNHRISSIDYYLAEISFFNLSTIWLLKDYIINTKADIFVENIYKNTIILKNILF